MTHPGPRHETPMNSPNEGGWNRSYDRLLHELIRAYCVAHDQPPLPVWEESPAWAKDATRASIDYILGKPECSPSALHDHWMQTRLNEGWVYGPMKDADQKTHPMLIPFNELSEIERRKDSVFIDMVRSLNKPV